MVVEIILSSIALLISVAGIIFFFIKNKEVKKDLSSGNGIYVTNDASSLKTYMIIFIIANLGFIALLVTSILKVIGSTDFYLYFIMCILIYGITGHYILTALLTYVCFCEEEIRVKKIFKGDKDINYSLIKMVGTSPNYVILGDGSKSILSFTVTSNNAKEAVEFLQNKGYKIPHDLLLFYDLITPENKIENSNDEGENNIQNEDANENKEEVVKDNNPLEKYTEKQLQSFELIGKEFRENVIKNRKKDYIKSIVTQILLIIVIVIFALLMQNYLLLFFILFSVYLIFNKNKELNAKYNLDGKTDIELGINYAYENKKVKGYHEFKNKSLKSSAIMFGIFFAIFAGLTGYMYFTSQPITYEGMTEISGTLTEIKEDTSIIIKISDNEEKYKDYIFIIPNGLNPYFESDEILNEEINQATKMKVMISESEKQAVVYYISIGEDVYVNIETLNSYVNNYKNNTGTIFFVIVGAFVLFIGGIVGISIYNKKQIPTETIDIQP